MTMTRMRIKQIERSGIPALPCPDAADFPKLPTGGGGIHSAALATKPPAAT